MAQLGTTFDANTVEPNKPFEVVPPDKYLVQITNSEVRPTKKGDGQYVWLELDIIDGPFAGRKIWDNLNLWNPNQQAVDIAQRTLSAICHATGQMAVNDTEQLHFRPLVADVRVKPAEGQYLTSNIVKGYLPADGDAASAQRAPAPAATARPATAAPVTAAAKPAGTAPPWRRTA